MTAHRTRKPGTRQIDDVRRAMRAGKWLTLDELEQVTHHPQAAISARLRDLRKRPGCDVERRLRTGHKSLHEYRMTTPPAPWEVGGDEAGRCVMCCELLQPSDDRPWHYRVCRECGKA